DRVAAGEVVVGERLVDHTNPGAVAPIGVLDFAPQPHRYAERRKISRADDVQSGVVIALVLRYVTFDGDGRRQFASTEDAEGREARGLTAGSTAERVDQVAQHVLAACADVSRLAEIDAHEQETLRRKAEIRTLQVVDRPPEQAGADQQRQ